VVCVGYLGEMIEERIGTEQFGVRISYSYDAPGLDGTLGAIRRALPLLPDRFLVLYGDTYLRLDYRAAVKRWQDSGLPALMTVLRNAGRWDASNAVYENGRVIAYDKLNPTAQMDWIDFGPAGVETRALSFGSGAHRDLSALYAQLAALGELCGYEVRDRFYEIGSPTSLREADLFLRDEKP